MSNHDDTRFAVHDFATGEVINFATEREAVAYAKSRAAREGPRHLRNCYVFFRSTITSYAMWTVCIRDDKNLLQG